MTIARSTSLRRASALDGFLNGLYSDGACGRPASSADCESVKSFACFEKYVSAAASMPIEVRPFQDESER